MNAAFRNFRRFCAVLIGVVFFFGGVLKLMDPVGASMVVREYFIFLHLPFMIPSAKFFAVAMALLETVTGAALVCGVFRRAGAAATSAMLASFTLLTLILLVFNPSMDCGCFGEAVHLTHLQSFLKNVVLDLLAVAAFLPLRDYGKATKMKFVSFCLTVLFALGFCVYSLLTLPLVDFTDFKCGSYLEAARDRAPGAAESAVEMEFIYEKGGEEKAFPLDGLPDSTWTFVDSRTKEYDVVELPVLQLVAEDGTYEDHLAAEGDVAIISFYSRLRDVSSYKAMLENAGFTTLVLATEFADGIDHISDFKTLLTLNRSNGGLTLVRDGRIVWKAASTALPDEEKLKALAGELPAENLSDSSRDSRLFQSFLLLESALLFLL
ncbi:MAG: DoxX family protein [Bacteroidales bacterium]|nr:DoxX family protein [Bacteroidales bacterium]